MLKYLRLINKYKYRKSKKYIYTDGLAVDIGLRPAVLTDIAVLTTMFRLC
jgi:hypothetical protein